MIEVIGPSSNDGRIFFFSWFPGFVILPLFLPHICTIKWFAFISNTKTSSDFILNLFSFSLNNIVEKKMLLFFRRNSFWILLLSSTFIIEWFTIEQHISIITMAKRIKFCKLDHLIECFIEPGLYLSAQTNGTGIPRNSMDFEQFCL